MGAATGGGGAEGEAGGCPGDGKAAEPVFGSGTVSKEAVAPVAPATPDTAVTERNTATRDRKPRRTVPGSTGRLPRRIDEEFCCTGRTVCSDSRIQAKPSRVDRSDSS